MGRDFKPPQCVFALGIAGINKHIILIVFLFDANCSVAVLAVDDTRITRHSTQGTDSNNPGFIILSGSLCHSGGCFYMLIMALIPFLGEIACEMLKFIWVVHPERFAARATCNEFDSVIHHLLLHLLLESFSLLRSKVSFHPFGHVCEFFCRMTARFFDITH